MKQNWKNKTVWQGDNLPIMRGLNSASVDLIYLDPPFNSKKDYAAPIGSPAAGAEFKDTWTLNEIDETWLDLISNKHPDLHKVIMATLTNSDKSYLIYMAVRILEMHRILKPSGSIYLHCDPTMSHYLKLTMDAIFGRRHFRNEIIWCYSRPSAPKQRQLSRVHDVILWYTKGDVWTFNPDKIRQPYAESSRGREGYAAHASKVAEGSVELHRGGKFPQDWIDIPMLKGNAREYVGYPTQKPLALLERIINASSDVGDTIFDPFCGCATTLVAADRLQRNWIGIDVSHKAYELVIERIAQDQGEEAGDIRSHNGGQQTLLKDITARKDTPKRTDLGRLPPYNSKKNKAILYGNQEGHCGGCGTHFEARHLEIDHIIAKADGGTDHIDNLQLLCGNCNRSKAIAGRHIYYNGLMRGCLSLRQRGQLSDSEMVADS